MVLSTNFHWRGPSILKFENIIGTVDGQIGIVLEGLDKGVHGDVIVRDGIKIRRNSRFYNYIIFWGLVTHIAYLPLFGDVKAIKMIVFWRPISSTLVHAQITVTEGRACARTNQLIVATMGMAIMVVNALLAHFLM
jgi:hypothetical protein